MQNPWPYEFSLQGVRSICRNLKGSLARKIFGVPKVEGESLREIASNTILQNAEKNYLRAGRCQFRYMWTTDFGKSFSGLLRVLDENYLRRILQRMIDTSLKKKRVPACFSRWFSFDIPFRRADGLPWLIHSVEKYVEFSKDNKFLEENRIKLETIFNDYLDRHYDFENHLIKSSVFGDWADSVLRASSTYNNLCLLAAFQSAKALGLAVKNDSEDMEKSLIAKRWNGKYFREFEGAQDWLAADANVFALYFKLFHEWLRKALFLSIEESELVKPFPIRCHDGKSKAYKPFFTNFSEKYHELIWTHLGLVYLNGLKKNGFDYGYYLKDIEDLLASYRNFIEVFGLDRKPYSAFLHVSEHSLTMAAGQYLELVE